MNNLNDLIRIRLREEGLRIIKESPYYYKVVEEENGDKYLHCSLWELSNLFGEYMFMGSTNTPVDMDFEFTYKVHK